MDSLIYLFKEYTLPTLFTLIVFIFLAVKEIWGAVEWVIGKLNAYHNKRSKNEKEKLSTDDRLITLEKHDRWQYDVLMDVKKSLAEMNKTLEGMNKKQEKATVATARSALYHLSHDILERGYMSEIEYECFKELYDVYIENNGNHTMKDKIAPEVFKLEIR